MAPKIYHLHPLVAGDLANWPSHFALCQAMGFDTVCVAPPFLPGASGDIFITGDHEVLHPALGWTGGADAGIARIVEQASEHGLCIWLDLSIDQVAIDATIRRREHDWFAPGGCGALPTPWRAPHRLDVAYARLQQTEIAEAMAVWWLDRLTRLVRAGVTGFRCLDPDHAPASLWRRIITTLKQEHEDCAFLAWTPGVERSALPRLEGIGFDHVCSSLAWWDGRANWLIDEMEILRRIAPIVASPEPSFFERRALRVPPGGDIAVAYRFGLRLAAATANGLFVPMGYEYATRRPFDAALAGPEDLQHARDEAPFDLTADIASANAMVGRVAACGVNGEVRQLTDAEAPVTALLRVDAPDARNASRAVLVLANPDIGRAAPLGLSVSPLPPQAGAAFALKDIPQGADASLAPGEVRTHFYPSPAQPVRHSLVCDNDLDPLRLAATRIAIEAVEPRVPDGAFAVKRLVGESVTVSADIFADGHELLAAELLWRAEDETAWRRVPMRPVVNDRWEARFVPARVGRHRFTVRAWWDTWETFRHDLTAKHAAGQAVSLEIEEGCHMIEAAPDRGRIAKRVRSLDTVQQVALLLSEDTAQEMHAADDQPFANELTPAIPLEVDRPQAAFASWYEMFPRSATDDPERHGTFSDVIARLPLIRSMGFDVLYFPPINPIGTTNRKGRNNALRAEPGDLGSPYAIGGPEGGHDAIHPALGTLDDFRALVAAAKDNELEIALDFAIQCSPDHPWLREHHDWFRWRSDGSMRFAENPPKKYEDIVNPDFYAKAAMPALWLALRDVVQFWVDQGVRIFRVDNPHTKPLPFWHWMITDIRGRHPDVLFLAEAFTRPKMMYRLAKVGFTQSYTYFTWRNTKQEITRVPYRTECPAGAGILPPEFLCEHTGYQPAIPADVGPTGISDPRSPRVHAGRSVGNVFRI